MVCVNIWKFPHHIWTHGVSVDDGIDKHMDTIWYEAVRRFRGRNTLHVMPQYLDKFLIWFKDAIFFFWDRSLGRGEKTDGGIFYLGLGDTSISLKRCLCSSRSNHSSKPELVDKLFFWFADRQMERSLYPRHGAKGFWGIPNPSPLPHLL